MVLSINRTGGLHVGHVGGFHPLAIKCKFYATISIVFDPQYGRHENNHRYEEALMFECEHETPKL